MFSFGQRVANWLIDQIRRILSIRRIRSTSSLYKTAFGQFWVPNSPWTDTISRRICASRVFDEPILDQVMQHWLPGTKFVDVGANLGQMSIVAARRMLKLTSAGDHLPVPLVHAFEAQPLIRELLAENVDINDLSHLIRIHREPVWSSSGTLMNFPASSGDSFANWGSNSVSLGGHENAMLSRTIDDSEIEGPVSIIKIDIQGADLEAMIGARALIERDQPAIIFEYEDRLTKDFGRDFSDYWEFLTEVGYRIFWSQSDNFLAKHSPKLDVDVRR